MTKLACRYAIIQFMPYPETGEFANVGVVLTCPKTGFFGYKLQTRKYARYTHFFKDLSQNIYLRAIAGFSMELERVQKMVKGAPESYLRDQFKALMHPRDTVVKFGNERACLAENPKKEVEKLYMHYVEHDFVTPEYRELKLEKRVNQIIKGLDLDNPFRRQKLGRDEFTVTFPFIQLIDHRPAKVIKPFFLGQIDPNKIYDHADLWLMKLKRLKKRNQLPDQVLFTVEGPTEESLLPNLRLKAYEEACDNLKEIAEIADQKDEAQIIRFARGI